MAFDPSVISQIPDGAPDFVSSQAKGFQLKDLINQETLNSLKVRQEQKTVAESDFLSDLSKKYDMSNPQQASKAASEASKKGYPNLTTGIMKTSQSLQLGQAQADEAKFQLHGQVINMIDQNVGQILDSVRAQTTGPDGKPLLNASGTEKYDSNTKNAMTLAALTKAKADYDSDQSVSPESRQLFDQAIDRFMKAGPVTYDGVNKVYQTTQAGKAAFDKELARRKEVSGIQNQQDEMRHRGVEEKQNQEKIDLQKKSGFTPDMSDLLASFAEKGVSLPTGLRSRQQQIATLQGLIARNPGKSADEIAEGVKSGQISMGVSKTEGTVLARREAAILPVEKSITKPGGFLDQAQKAVDEVDFPKLKAAGGFESWGKDQLSDPKLTAYKAAVAELRAEYSIVLSKGGQVTDAARHEAAKVIPDLITKEQFKRIRSTVLNGIEASKGGVEESIGQTEGKPAPAAPAPSSNVVDWSSLK